MTTQKQVQWRRAKVLEMSSQGYSQIEIATQLQVDETIISKDVAHLRQQAQENLQRHIHEVVPEEYQKCMVGIKHNLKHILEIAQIATDPKVKLQARTAANDCYRYIMELCTNAGIVSDAMKCVTQKQEQINTLQKIDERIEAMNEEEDKTTDSGIY